MLNPLHRADVPWQAACIKRALIDSFGDHRQTNLGRLLPVVIGIDLPIAALDCLTDILPHLSTSIYSSGMQVVS